MVDRVEVGGQHLDVAEAVVDRIHSHVGGEHPVLDRAQVLVGGPVGGGELHQFLTDGSHPVVEGGEALLEQCPLGQRGIELRLQFGGLLGLQFGGLLGLSVRRPAGPRRPLSSSCC